MEDIWLKQDECLKKCVDKYTEKISSGIVFAIFGKSYIERFCDEVAKEKAYAQTTKQA